MKKKSSPDPKGQSIHHELVRLHLKRCWTYIRGFATWVVVGLILGVVGGLVGTAFCYGIGFATEFRSAHLWIVWLLPLGGLFIAWMYGLRGQHPTDTNGVLLAIHTPASIPRATGPMIFIATIVTHFFGGSAGREGAALQLGGVLGSRFASLVRFKNHEEDKHIVVMAGMSAVFSALFGAPLTAAVFAMEVASVGILHFSAIIPCLTSSLTAVYLSRWLGVAAEVFPLSGAALFSFAHVGSVALIAAVCAAVSIVYCVSLRQGGHLFARLLPNPYLRIFCGGLCVAILTAVLGTGDYNGAGMNVIADAIGGSARPEAFIIKLLLTVLTMGCGYKGGEIVPAMFIGSTLGCVLGNLLGLPVGLGAAVGLLCMFCGSLNCPISSILLGVELFGADNIQFFAIAAAVSYILSANFGLYAEQKIVYSKLRPKYINRYTE